MKSINSNTENLDKLNEKTFSDIGYAYLDKILEELIDNSNIKILYPISDFTAEQSLFKIYTLDKRIAINTYSKYKEEIVCINREISRIEKRIKSLNDKFYNSDWLSKCTEDIILKEYNNLCRLEVELDLKHKQIIDRTYVIPKIQIENTQTNDIEKI